MQCRGHLPQPSPQLHPWAFEEAAKGKLALQNRVQEGYDSATAEQQLVRLLELRHGKKDVFTWNMDSILKTAERTTHTLQLFLTLVAVIALVVGGIGVMNIMLVSVTERTREIGLRKALGATRGKILNQFLIESIVLTLLGGLIGLGLAYLGVKGLTPVLKSQNIIPAISLQVVVISLIFSAFVGVVFGILPANKASKLDPIEALRYE